MILIIISVVLFLACLEGSDIGTCKKDGVLSFSHLELFNSMFDVDLNGFKENCITLYTFITGTTQMLVHLLPLCHHTIAAGHVYHI